VNDSTSVAGAEKKATELAGQSFPTPAGRLLQGQVAVVTGGASGIGLAITTALAREGASVAILDLDLELAREAAARIQKAGGAAGGHRADVADGDTVQSALQEVLKQHGRMDILVNNAVITRDGLLLRMSDEQWEKVVDINLRGAFYCSRAAARSMIRARYGRIINIASVVGISGNAGQANYVASKAGLIGLTKALAQELAPRGITVNAVAPGFIKTAMTDALGEETRKALLNKVPLGRLGTPEDVAEVVAFLASARAAYITGQVVVVDGGMVMA
jgi:3-oxoacyl-[acyl-carrier protein] reductase